MTAEQPTLHKTNAQSFQEWFAKIQDELPRVSTLGEQAIKFAEIAYSAGRVQGVKDSMQTVKTSV